jgi:uncharacterized protein involved in exopolysaccharide biosynthesis
MARADQSVRTPSPDEGVTLPAFLQAMVADRRLVLALVVGAMAIALAVAVWRGQRWQAEASFLPQPVNAVLGTRGGDAAVAFRSETPGESQDFYVSLVRSRELLTEVLRTPATRPPAGRAAAPAAVGERFIDRFAPGQADGRDREQEALDELRRHVAVRPDLKSGLVQLTTTADAPDEAEWLARRVLDLVNDFNLKRRQSRAAAERAFIEERLAQAREDLTAAEEALRAFGERNLAFDRAPRLAIEQQRLARRVELAQNTYRQLAEAREEARIEAVRTTPVITIVDAPEGSAHRPRLLALALGAGFVVGVLLAVTAVSLRLFAAPTVLPAPDPRD